LGGGEAEGGDKAKDSESGPSYYTVKRFKLGEALIEVVRRTLRENALSHTKAAKVLGVGLSSVEPLIRRVEESHRSTPRR
jgi:predicted XRE-type DNA-binding protein